MPGGRLLIADFAPHDVEELRTRDAHARLGFSDEQMLGWFEAAGLLPARTETLEGGELTVKLWHARKAGRSEEHTSELQSIMRISYAVLCLKKKNKSMTREQLTTN